MPLPKNRVIIACAGSRKTTTLVDMALSEGNNKQRILVTTYTNENVDTIRSYFIQKHGCIPANVTVMSWYSFLLAHGIRPYQNMATSHPRVAGIFFDQIPGALRYVPRANVERYFFASPGIIFRDRVAEFVCYCDSKSNGAVAKRISKVFDCIYVDELQDLAGYDLDFLEVLFRSRATIVAVGDPRQTTFSTNNSKKNSAYKSGGLVDWLNARDRKLIALENQNVCYRSNQAICDFADALFPEYCQTISTNEQRSEHDGIYLIPREKVLDYVKQFRPLVLRYDCRADTLRLPAFNIGAMKGKTFDRVLIFPTKKVQKYLKTKNLSDVGSKEKLYVAITRARYSVAIVI